LSTPSQTRLAERLKNNVEGDILFDSFSRGRYATDASHYQMMPLGAVVPRSMEAAARTLEIAREEGVPVTPRGGGTSQCGQTINRGLVIDGSKHLRKIKSLDVENQTCVVEPGIVLDDLNRALKPHGLWFPVDISTASRATIGGMTGNNSCGGRSLRYGTMRDNVIAVDAILPDGTPMHFGEVSADLTELGASQRPLAQHLLDIGIRERSEIASRFPKVQRRVGGYNIDALDPAKNRLNLAHILVGSEGTLAYTTAVELKLWPVLGKRAVGVCHFGTFYAAMEAAQHLVTLKPTAVELVDATMIELAREIAMFKPTLEAILRGDPAALLLVEFAEDEAENKIRMKELAEMMGDLGFGFDRSERKHWGGVVEVYDAKLQAAITDLRTSGLNIMMSMKDQRKPISFVEDCAVPLPHLAEYTENLTRVFEKHGTRGTWYAHAAEGCLHVRPVLNLRLEKDVKAMRAIAEEAFALVRAYKGSHSGEHGDGLVRSEFHETMFGSQLVHAFEDVKDTFDPKGLFNPGKIVRGTSFDDRNLFRYAPSYHVDDFAPHLDWSEYPGAIGGFQGAVEMCNNNGACRKLEGGAMCPSYRATRDERHVTRGRANSLRLALSGQIGADAFTSDDMAETMKLCVSCKSCKRECPTGVDMAKMKIEFLAARAKKNGYSLRDRLIAYMPHYAPYAARVAPLLNLRNKLPPVAWLLERLTGFSAKRSLPQWTAKRFDAKAQVPQATNGREVVLWADTFNAAFEPENLDAALKVLNGAGYHVHLAQPAKGERPLCCGRTFLSVGNVDAARAEMTRTLQALQPFLSRGVPVVGLEPSCLLTFRDELPSVLPGDDAKRAAAHALLFEEFIVREAKAGRFEAKLKPATGKVLLHGHCHQKAFGAMGAVEGALRLIPDIDLDVIESSCCGMAGAFGYQAETIDVSQAMAELSLLPAVRKEPDAIVVADGTSCRHQIKDGAQREAMHVARLIASCMA